MVTILELGQQAKYGHAIRRRGKHLAVGDHWRDEFVAAAEMVAAVGRLVAVIEFLGQVIRGVGVQYGRARIFNRPDDAIRVPIRRNARKNPRECERGCRVRGRAGVFQQHGLLLRSGRDT